MKAGLYGFAYAEDDVKLVKGRLFEIQTMVAAHLRLKVLTVYSKGGGKNGKHAWVSSCTSIGAVSYLAGQLLDYSDEREFIGISDNLALFQTPRFLLLPPSRFLAVLLHKPVQNPSSPDILVVHETDWDLFTQLRKSIRQVELAVKALGTRVTNE
jgi:hypothetical protein